MLLFVPDASPMATHELRPFLQWVAVVAMLFTFLLLDGVKPRRPSVSDEYVWLV